MKHRFLGAACACLLVAASGAARAAPVSGQGTWETTLQGRDLDGNLSTIEAYFDTTLNITWLADANYYVASGASGYGGMNWGGMPWQGANNWAASLNPYGSGVTGWRLPTVVDTGFAGCSFFYRDTECGYNVNTETSELAHMFYITLGNKGYYDRTGSLQSGWGLTNTGLFSNLQAASYWSNTVYAPYTADAWFFSFYYGVQNHDARSNYYYAWAVHDGDVGVAITASTVPVPAAAWLFGTGLLGLVGIAKRKRVM